MKYELLVSMLELSYSIFKSRLGIMNDPNIGPLAYDSYVGLPAEAVLSWNPSTPCVGVMQLPLMERKCAVYINPRESTVIFSFKDDLPHIPVGSLTDPVLGLRYFLTILRLDKEKLSEFVKEGVIITLERKGYSMQAIRNSRIAATETGPNLFLLLLKGVGEIINDPWHKGRIYAVLAHALESEEFLHKTAELWKNSKSYGAKVFYPWALVLLGKHEQAIRTLKQIKPKNKIIARFLKIVEYLAKEKFREFDNASILLAPDEERIGVGKKLLIDPIEGKLFIKTLRKAQEVKKIDEKYLEDSSPIIKAKVKAIIEVR